MNFFRHVRALFAPALLSAVAATVWLGLAPAAQGQTSITKAATGTDLNASASWTPNTVPGAVNLGIFTTVSNTATATYSSNLTLGELQILTPTGAITINGSTSAPATNTFFLGNSTFTNGGGIDMSNATQALTLGANVSLVLQSAQTWTVGNATTHPGLTIAGTLNTNGNSLTIGGTSPVTLSGIISGVGPIYLNTSNTTTLSAVNTMTGGLNLDSGTLVLTNNGTGSGSSLGGPTNVFGILGASSLNTGASAVTIATNNQIQLDSNLTFVGSNNLNLGTGVVIVGGSNVTVSITANTMTFGGNIVDGGALNYSNAISLTKAGASGTLALNGTNTFSGNFNMQAGTVTLNNSLALQNATLNYTGGSVVYGAGITDITVGGLAGGTNLALPTGNMTIATSPFDNASYASPFGVANYTGVLSGAGNVNISGNGTQIFSGANTYTGLTNLMAGTLVINNTGSGTTNSAIGTGNLNITGGTLDAGSAMNSGTALTTNNILTFGGSFTFAGSNNLNLGTGAVNLTTTPTLTLSGNTLTIGGKISGAFGLTQNGSGTLVLSNTASNFSGAVTINGGTLSVTKVANGGTASSLGNSTNAQTNLVINGGTLQFAGSSAQSTDRLMTIGSNGATFDGSGAAVANNITFSNTSAVVYPTVGFNPVLTFTGTAGTAAKPNTFDPIIGDNANSGNPASVIKNGTGLWELNGVNTYTGGTTLNSGTLEIGNSAGLGTGALTITGGSFDNASGATLTLSSALAQKWNGNWTFVGTQALDMNTGAITLGTNVTLTVSNTLTLGGSIGDGHQGYSLTKTGTGTLFLNNTNTFSGNLNLQQGPLIVNSNLALQNATLNYTGGTDSFITNNVTLAGLSGTVNFTLPTANLTINTSNVTPSSNGSPAQSAYTFANLTYSGVLSGSGQIIMAGNGTESFTAKNTYTGGTLLNGGTIALNVNGTGTANSAIGTGTLTFNGGNIDNSSGGNISLAGGTGTNNAISINKDFTFEGTNNLNLGTGAVTLNAATANITVAGHTLTIGGNISGVGGLVLLGSQAAASGGGTLVLSGNNSFNGGIVVDAGWLDINNGGNATTSSLGIANATPGTGQLNLNGGNIDNTSGSTQTIGTNNQQIWQNNFTFRGSNSLNLGTGAVTLSFSPVVSVTGNTLTVGGTITGSSGLTLNGQGTLALTNASSNFTGFVNLNGGTLSVSTLANGGSVSSMGNSSSVASNLNFNGGTLQLLSSTATQTTNRLFTINANGATIDASSATAADTVTWANTSQIAIGSTSATTTLTLTGNSGNNTTFNIFDPIIINNTTAGKTNVVKNGSGEWSLNATNTYTGGTTVNAGTLGIQQAGALGTTGALTINGGSLDNTSGATLTLSTALAQNWNGNWTFVGTKNLDLNTGAVTMNAPVNLTITGNTLTVGGQISDGGVGYTFTKSGTGTLVLSNNLSLQDSTLNVSAGVLTFGQTNATIGGLAGATALTGPATLTLNSSFFFNNNYSGALSGTTALAVNGTGIQDFSGPNTYTGTTTVNGGTLLLGNNAALGTSALTMNGGNLDSNGKSITNALNLNKNFTYVGTGTLTQATGAITLGQANETINVAASTLTLGGVISSSGNILTKAGAGTLVLTHANGYTGGTVVNGGTLALTFQAANNTAAATIVSNNTALTLNGGALAVAGVSGASNTNTQTFSGTTIGAGASVVSETMSLGTLAVNLGTLSRTPNSGGTLDVEQNVGGASSVTSSTTTTTSGVMTSGGVAYVTFSSSTSSLLAGTDWANISANKIVAATSTADIANTSWVGTSNDRITVASTTMTAGSQALNSLDFTGTSTLALNGGTLTMTTGGILQSSNATGAEIISGGNLTAGNGELVVITNNSTAADGISISGNIVGAIALTKSGLGNLSLTGTGSNFSGNINLNAGTLSFNNANGLGTTANALNINGGSLDAGAASLTMARPENWNGNWTFVGSNALILSNTTTLSSNIVLTTTSTTNALTVSGPIGGAFSLTSAGPGILTLNGTNTFTGGLILNGGTLNINSATALGGSTNIFTINNSANIDNTNATLTVTNNNAQVWNSGFKFLASNNLNLGTGAVALGANDTIIVNAAKTLTVGGNIGGSTTSTGAANTLASQFGLTLGNGTAGSTGTLVLSGNNSYNGGTTVTNGTLVLSGNNIGTGNTTLGANGNLDINQGGNSTSSALGTGTLVINGGKIDNASAGTQTVATNNAVNINNSFTYTGATQSLNLGTGNVTLGATPTITVSSNTLTLGGAVSGAFGLTKTGAGTLVLGGNNSYTGATTVSLGTLELASNNALGINALGTTVASGATLQLDNGYNTGSGTSSSTGSLLTIAGVGNGTTFGGALLNGATALNGTANWNGNIALSASATISAGATDPGNISNANTITLSLGNTSAASFTTNYGNISNISIGSNTLTFVGAANTTTEVAANITGNNGNVIINTAGNVSFRTLNNSYTGLTTVQNGTLIIRTQSNGANVTAGEGNLAIQGNLVIGSGSGTTTDAIVQLGINGTQDTQRVINDQSTVTINADGKLNAYGNQQTIGNLIMSGGDIDTNGTTGHYGLLATNGNTSITVQSNTTTSVINGNFSMGNSNGGTLTTINVANNGSRTSDLTINALLSGGSFIQTGNGIVTLNNQVTGAGNINSFTGSAEVQGGTLVITASDALGASDNSAGKGTQVDAGAQLQINQTIATPVAVPNELLTLNGQGTGGSDGALRNVNGTNSWAGNVLVNSSATINTAGASTLTLSGCVSSSTAATLTFNGTGNTTISGSIAGSVNLNQNMNSGSTLLITNSTTNNTFTGTTTVNSGILELHGNVTGTTLIPSGNLTINTGGTLLTDTNGTLGNVNMVLNGGTWETNAAHPSGTGQLAFSSNNSATAQSNYAESVNTLTLTATSNITLGANANILNFTNSTGAIWTPGQVLYINNWVGLAATSVTGNLVDGLNGGGGQDQIIFGSSNTTALDGSAFTGQLGEIIFVNPQDSALGWSGLSGNYHAVIESNGEIVPFVAAPEPGTMAAGAALGGLALLREWRRRKSRGSKNIS